MDVARLRQILVGLKDDTPVIIDNVTKFNQIESSRVMPASDEETFLILSVDPEPFSW